MVNHPNRSKRFPPQLPVGRTPNLSRPLQPGDRVLIIGDHPHATEAGTIVAFEEYGPGGGLRWKGARIALDAGGECYADPGFLRRTA